MNTILLGAVAMGCVTISLFFVHFWRTTHDRFFLFFAAAFCIEGGNRLMLGLIDYSSEQEPFFYLLRLVSYLIILYAIIDKNWLRNHRT